MLEALLCDIDGTLVQSNWLHAEAWQIALGAIGIHIPLEDLRRQIGKGGDELIPVFVPWWKRKQVEEPLQTFRKHIFQHDYMHRVEPLPQVRDFFLRLQQANIRPALASSAGKEDLATYKRIAHIEDLVDEETSADDAKHSKPHPDIFTAALHRLKLPASKCMALGDTPYDAEAAGLAGLRTIGVTGLADNSFARFRIQSRRQGNTRKRANHIQTQASIMILSYAVIAISVAAC